MWVFFDALSAKLLHPKAVSNSQGFPSCLFLTIWHNHYLVCKHVFVSYILMCCCFTFHSYYMHTRTSRIQTVICHFIVLELWIIFHWEKSQTMLRGATFLVWILNIFQSAMFLKAWSSVCYSRKWDLQEVVPKRNQAIRGVHWKEVFMPWTIHQSLLSSYYEMSVLPQYELPEMISLVMGPGATEPSPMAWNL